MKMKTCFLLYTLDPGGLEVYLLRFLKYAGDGIEPVVICKSGRTGELLAQYEALNVRVITMKTGYLNFPAWFRLLRFLREEKFDTVCDLTSNFAGIYMLLGWLAGIQNRIAYYGQASNHFKETSLNLAYDKFVNRLVHAFSSRILSNSKTAIDFFFPYRNKKDGRFELIPNGVDSRQFKVALDKAQLRSEFGLPDNAFVIGHTGRFDEKKNHAAILEVAERLCPKHEDLYFVLCGLNTQQLAPEIAERGLEGRILPLGYRSDVERLLQLFDLFYFPSLTEGQPNSLIEAMIAGLPFVASDIQPIRDTIPEALHSQLVGPMDIEGAAEKLMELRNDAALRESKVRKEWAADFFSSEKRFEQFLDSLAGNYAPLPVNQ